MQSYKPERQFRRMVIQAVLVPILLVVFAAGCFLWQTSRLMSSARWVEHSDEAINDSIQLQKLIVDMETGLRGYLVTGKGEFLEPYQLSGGIVREAFNRLGAHIADDSQQSQRLAAIREQFTSWESYAERMIRLRQRGGNYHSASLNDTGKQKMDVIRASMLSFIDVEQTLRETRSQGVRTAIWQFAASGLIFLLLAGGVFGLISRKQLHVVASTYQGALDMAEEQQQKLEGEVNVRQQLQIELKEQVQELSELDRRKDEFLAMLAHELRNPLAPVLNAVRILDARSHQDPASTRARQIIHRQVQHLSRLVDDLLDMARLNEGKITLHKTQIDLETVLGHLVDLSQMDNRSADLNIELDLPVEPLQIHADRTRLEQAIGNLLSNAIKFTPPEGTITVSARTESLDEQPGIRISVNDTGAGIPAELLPSVFELFVQGPQDLARTQGGLGIGLSITKRLVELHGGVIDVQSSGEGQGSTFSFWLPLGNTTQPGSAPEDAPVEKPIFGALRVLLVDDNMDMLETLGELISMWGCEVDTAADGVVALNLAAKVNYDLVLLDIGLPGMDGREVARRLRSRMNGRPLQIIAITGYAPDSASEGVEQSLFDEYLIKPLDPEKLREKISRMGGEPEASSNGSLPQRDGTLKTKGVG